MVTWIIHNDQQTKSAIGLTLSVSDSVG